MESNSKQALNKLFENLSCKHCECSDICMFSEYDSCECEFWHQLVLKDLQRLETLEKYHKQLKLNFKNSQIHSKNCYKKLKVKYEKLEKENQELLVNKNVAQGIAIKLKEENNKLKQAIKILKKEIGIELGVSTLGEKYYYSLECSKEYSRISKEQYKLLKEVLEDE